MYSLKQAMPTILNTYYAIKPTIPRRLQLWLRRNLVRRKLNLTSALWPIWEIAGCPPANWPGWPEDKQFAVILTHDVEHKRGVERCKELSRIEIEFGFRSSFNFVPERYELPDELPHWLRRNGFEVGVHGLNHDGRLYESKETFLARAERINNYIAEWGAVGFRSPSMHHNLEWLGHLDIEYDLSTFDTDPFEPQGDGVATIFPFLVERVDGRDPYVEMPYTLPQDHTLFIVMQEQTIDIWKNKIDWIVQHGGMILVNVHPDYISFGDDVGWEEYPVAFYRELLVYIEEQYSGRYWNALPAQVADYYRSQLPKPHMHRLPEELVVTPVLRPPPANHRTKSSDMPAIVN